MSYKVDYHIHSYYSDGNMKPTELVRMYHENEYDIIAITDHDNIDGVKEAMIAGDALKIKVIPGIELATVTQGVEMHLLGYNFDVDDSALNETITELKENRRARNEQMLATLSRMGYTLTEEDLKAESPFGYIGKPNIARALVTKGYISSPVEAFEPGKLLESPEIKSIKRKKLTTEEAIEIINNAGGMAVMAHPGKLKGIGDKQNQEYWDNLDDLLKRLKKAGLKGLECIYPSHSEEEMLRFVDLAGKYHLHITEGSDFHGKDMQK